MPAPVFRSAASADNAGASTTLVISKPAGAVDGDLLFSAISVDGNETVTPPAGWTLIRNSVSGTAARFLTYYRIAASEPASYTWTFSVAVRNAGGIAAYSGAAASPLDVEGGQVNASSTSCTAPAIVTTFADTLLIFAGGTKGGATFTPPAGMIERVDLGTDVSTEICDASQAAIGSTGTKVATLSVARINFGHLAAFKGAVVASGDLGTKFVPNSWFPGLA